MGRNRFLDPFYYIYERRLLAEVKRGPLPQHVGVIQDGNRRHSRQAGVFSLRDVYLLGAVKTEEVLRWCAELKIPVVTLWWLSTENMTRNPDELAPILDVIEEKMVEWMDAGLVHQLRTRLRPIGQLERLPASTMQVLRRIEAETQRYDGLILNVGVGYGGRHEIVDAVRSYLQDRSSRHESLEQMVQELSPEALEQFLYTSDCPDLDLIIRTSGEIRLSGFMLWQSAYAEFYFCDANWPAFRKIDFLRAIRSYQRRQRRFGQ